MPRPPEADTSVDTQPARQWVRLEYSPRAKTSMAAVFNQGHFRPSVNALQEFVHNAVDYRNEGQDKPATAIFISIRDDAVAVLSVNEDGMGPDELQKVVSIGTSGERGVAIGGMGAAAAASYFSEDLLARGQKAGEKVQWTLQVRGFGDPQAKYEGDFPVDPKVVSDTAGMAEIILTGLKVAKADLPGGAEIRRDYGRAFRPLLVPPDIEIPSIRNTKQVLPKREVVDAKGKIVEASDRISLFVTRQKKTERAYPLPKPLKDGYSEDLEIAWSGGKPGEGVPIGYWVGEVNRAIPEGKRVDKGFDIFLDGRLIDMGKLFGFDSNAPGLQDLIGEVYADHVPKIKSALTYNKAAGIARDSEPWKLISATMHRELEPLVEELTNKPVAIDMRLPSTLEAAAAEARKFADAVIGRMFADDEVMQELLGLTAASPALRVQKPPKPGENKSPSPAPLGVEGTGWEQQNPVTYPTADAVDNYPRKRRGFTSGISYRSLGQNSAQRSILSIEKEGTPEEKRYIVINTDHPQFQVLAEHGRKDPDWGKVEIITYLSEEVVRHVARTIGGNNLAEVDKHEEDGTYKLWELLRKHGAYSAINVRPDAELKTKKKKR